MKYNTDNRSNSQNEPMFNFGAIFAKYKRYWWLFALSFVGCMCLAAFYIYLKKQMVEMMIDQLRDENPPERDKKKKR